MTKPATATKPIASIERAPALVEKVYFLHLPTLNFGYEKEIGEESL